MVGGCADRGDPGLRLPPPPTPSPTFGRDYNSLLDDPLKPLNNRAFSGLYPPGSTFKMISAIAGLEEEIITPPPSSGMRGSTPIGRRPSRSAGSTASMDAPTDRSTYPTPSRYPATFFYDVGRRVGIEKLDEYAAKFGLGQKTGVELSEAAGVVASPEFTGVPWGKWYEGNVVVRGHRSGEHPGHPHPAGQLHLHPGQRGRAIPPTC